MDKKILEDYIDACEFIKETEAEIKKLEKRKRIVQDEVRGSNPEFPYEERSFNLGGTIETVEDASALAREKQLLEEQRRVASDLKLGVEEWMQEIPFRMQRIIRYKIFSGLSWEETATLNQSPAGVGLTSVLIVDIAALAALAALERPLASMIAAPRF